MINKSALLTPSKGYKPFRFPWAYEAWDIQQKIHWLPDDVPLANDVRDWNTRLTHGEKNLLTQIFRFFTQADIDVADNYLQRYMPVFKPTEVLMMLTAFASSETIHIASYSHLLDTLGIPEVEYMAFLEYKELKDKHQYMESFSVENPYEIAKTLAAFGAFTEGLQLFASFAMLLNFPRQGKMTGMGQIITYSVRDETLHCDNVIRLFHTFCREHTGLFDDKMKADLVNICQTIVGHEDAFIDLAFRESGGEVEGMTADEIKKYIRFIADRRLIQLGLTPIYGVKVNPLPWLDEVLNSVEHVNFFENRATEYSRAATQGTWDEAF